MVKAEAAGGGGRKIGQYELELMKTTWIDPTTTESEDWSNAAANLRGIASRIRTSDLGEYWDSDAGKEARKTLEILYKRIDRHAEKLEKVKKSLDDVEKARKAAKTAYDELPSCEVTDCQVNAQMDQMHPPLVYKNPSEHELPEDQKRAKAWQQVYEQNKRNREEAARRHLKTFNTSMTEASQVVPLPEGAERPPTTGGGTDTGGGGYPGSTGTSTGSGNHSTNPTNHPTQPPYNTDPGPDNDPINTHPTDPTDPGDPTDPDLYPTEQTDTETTDTDTYPTDTTPYPTDDGADGTGGTWQTGPGGSYLPGGDTSADGVVSGVIPGASGGPGGLNGLSGTYPAGAAAADGGLSAPAALGGGLVTGGASGLAAKAFGGKSGAVPATGPGGMATSARGGAGASGATRSAAARSGSTSRASGRPTGMSEAASGGRGSRGMTGMAMGGRGAGGGAAGSGARASARTGSSRYGAPKLAEKAAAGKGGQGTGRGAAGAMAGSRGQSGSKEREQHDRDFLTHEDEENWYDEESEAGPAVFE